MNHYAWIPNKLRYDGFNELQQAASILKSSWSGQLEMGKADFKSAYKPVPPAEDQAWLCWALVHNPHLGVHQVTQLHSQTFGGLGAVIAWYRAAKAIQVVMEQLGLVVLMYVDDCFWVAPKTENTASVSATWILRVFEYVTHHLLGWSLDPDKSAVGSSLTLLGLQITKATQP